MLLSQECFMNWVVDGCMCVIDRKWGVIGLRWLVGVEVRREKLKEKGKKKKKIELLATPGPSFPSNPRTLHGECINLCQYAVYY